MTCGTTKYFKYIDRSERKEFLKCPGNCDHMLYWMTRSGPDYTMKWDKSDMWSHNRILGIYKLEEVTEEEVLLWALTRK